MYGEIRQSKTRKGGTGKSILKHRGKDVSIMLDLQPQPGVVINGTVTCHV